jgi:hypothetical protein
MEKFPGEKCVRSTLCSNILNSDYTDTCEECTKLLYDKIFKNAINKKLPELKNGKHIPKVHLILNL